MILKINNLIWIILSWFSKK